MMRNSSQNDAAFKLHGVEQWIGVGHPCLIVAEVGQAHDGSLGTAHAYIEAAAKAGADAVKFQTHIADAESTRAEPFRVQFSSQDATRYDYWKRMEFTPAAWRELADHARSVGLVFLSTPFSLEAVDLLQSLDVPAWKVGSGELTDLPLIERMAQTRKPVLLSSGMSSWQQLDDAAKVIRGAGAPLALLQCTTAYPCSPEQVGLNVMAQMRERYGCPVGLSDHSGTIYAGLAAAALGADVIEVHVVFSRECFGPDTPASVTTAELRTIVEGVRFIERVLAHPVSKDQVAADLTPLAAMFGKSVVAASDLPAGKQLNADDLALKKPGGGLPPARMASLVGCRLKRSLAKNQALTEEDVAS